MKRSFRRKLLRSASISVAAAGLTAVCVFASAYLLFPLNGIEVEGAKMFQRSELSDFDSRGSSLLTLNTSALEQRVLRDPWVKEASISKDWTKGIAVVEVQERKAVLLAETSDSQAVFAVDGEELPGQGSAGLTPVEMELYEIDDVLSAVRVMQESGAAVESVNAYGVEGIEATVEGRPVIFSSDVVPEQASELAGVMEENPGDVRFDLRSPGRIVVSSDTAFGGDSAQEPEG